MEFIIIIGWIILSFFVASFAKNKGRSFGGFLALALIISPIIALIVAAIVKDESEKIALKAGDLRKCPYCAETIKSVASVCKHCGKELPELPKEEVKEQKKTEVFITCKECGKESFYTENKCAFCSTPFDKG